MSELAVLQAVRLKGRVSLADLAVTLGEDADDLAGTVERLTESGLLVDGKPLRVSPDGRVRLAELLATERAHIDTAALADAYAEFRSVNAEFKALVTDWQLKDGQPNNHEDPDYDAAVLARLEDVHHRITPIVDAAAAQLPRLSRYSAKLQSALDNVHAGDTAWLSRPLIDSYHTVWFELHEELIVAAGLTRDSEAKSGDAQ
ncbi:MAG TPA: MarR family transcriptional regulator [Mycobacterium sp.]|uniref:MarR family transcriptional regulator n=1 Tax=Mycobacterium sp. TaxID=1785 RepID=UPI002D0A9C60|nr:MarR family transcriptional regulator [Mycobacterium sp.]HME79471.1 MarR family transcriptional regulator [Mycobacterium sp.]